jgi:hypothetical protein
VGVVRGLVETLVRMNDHARSSYGTDALTGWSFYARFYAWRFS